MRFEFQTSNKPIQYSLSQKITITIVGIAFIIVGTVAFFQNIPKAVNSIPITYNFGTCTERNAEFCRTTNTWFMDNKKTISFPGYSGLIWPPAFLLGGIFILICDWTTNSLLKTLMAGVFTAYLGITLSYLFSRYSTTAMIISIIFVVFGILLIYLAITKKIKPVNSLEQNQQSTPNTSPSPPSPNN